IERFKNDVSYRLDAMTHQFLPCLMQLKLSSDDDQAYISEIQRLWCLLLDKIEPQRLTLLEEFLQRLLEQPIGQHYHSVSINKNNLFSRYGEAVQYLYNKYPTHFAKEPTVVAASSISPVATPMISESVQQQTNDYQHHYQVQQQSSHSDSFPQSLPFTNTEPSLPSPLNDSRSSSSRPNSSHPISIVPTSHQTSSIPIPVQIQQPVNNSTQSSVAQLHFANRLHHHQEQPSYDSRNAPVSSYPQRPLSSTKPVTNTVAALAEFDRSSSHNSRNDGSVLAKSGSISPMQQDDMNDEEEQQQSAEAVDILDRRQRQNMNPSHRTRTAPSPSSSPPQS
ncbi:unnamed protein product, partial [Didymodactylos carnosus]